MLPLPGACITVAARSGYRRGTFFYRPVHACFRTALLSKRPE
jgi:hypothetical protein